MKKKMTFEEGMAELETIAANLESGEISLEESFKAYQKGMELYRGLQEILNEGDARIIELTREGERELKGEIGHADT